MVLADSHSVVTIVSAVGSILVDAQRDRLSTEDEREALGHLSVLAIALRMDDSGQARDALVEIEAVVTRARERLDEANRLAKEAAMVEDGWTPPEVDE